MFGERNKSGKNIRGGKKKKEKVIKRGNNNLNLQQIQFEE
jgi:hypothetical protein